METLTDNLQQNKSVGSKLTAKYCKSVVSLKFKNNPENSILSAVAVFKFKNKHSSVN
jgi:hypothetical protein